VTKPPRASIRVSSANRATAGKSKTSRNQDLDLGLIADMSMNSGMEDDPPSMLETKPRSQISMTKVMQALLEDLVDPVHRQKAVLADLRRLGLRAERRGER
jgi:hypothetical protein